MRAAVVVVGGALGLAVGGSSEADPARSPAASTSPTLAPKGASPGSKVDVTPPALEDVEHMCALLTSCDALPLPSGIVARDFATCVRTMQAELSSPAAVGFSLTLRECGLRSSSCGAMRTCALRGVKPDVCAGRGKAGSVELCDAEGRAVACSNERVTGVRDCPRGGEQCVVQGGKAQCALGSCEKDAPASCSPSGTRIVECKKGKLVSLDCSAFGLRCVSLADAPHCATAAPPCTDKTVRCEGGVAVGCHNGHEVRVDCAAAHLACGGTGTAVGACTGAPPSPSVPSRDAPDAPDAGQSACDTKSASRCDGSTIRWCAWGKPRTYLCKSMGLSRCVSDDKGARCAN